MSMTMPNRKPVEFAHQRKGADGSTSRKPSDTYGVNLCWFCHNDQHREGEASFWESRGINPYKVMIDNYTEYLKHKEAQNDRA